MKVTGYKLTRITRNLIATSVSDRGDPQNLCGAVEEQMHIFIGMESHARYPKKKLVRELDSLQRHIEGLSGEAKDFLNHQLSAWLDGCAHATGAPPGSASPRPAWRAADHVANAALACGAARELSRSR